MATRLRRAEQTERNRAAVLTAARRVFMARGYHAATLEQIAEEAGFSKGVVYSQFDSKADLFLALLEARIEERARENAKLVEDAAGEHGIAVLLDHVARIARAEARWELLVLEFRVHAARSRELNRRYAAAHARTVDGVAGILARLHERAGSEPPLPPRELAELILAIGAGLQLEQAANADALQGPLVLDLLAGLLTGQSRSAA
jgi:AcrR family transcriptional regulator